MFAVESVPSRKSKSRRPQMHMEDKISIKCTVNEEKHDAYLFDSDVPLDVAKDFMRKMNYVKEATSFMVGGSVTVKGMFIGKVKHFSVLSDCKC